MSDTDFSCDDSIVDKTYEVPKPKRSNRTYRRPSSRNDLLFNKYFEIIRELNNTEFQTSHGGIVAKCLTCKLEIKGASYVTSNFLRHLKKHDLIFKQYTNEKFDIANKDNTKTSLDKMLMDVFADSLIPFTLLESMPFKNFIEKLNSSYSLPSRPTAMKLIKKKFFQVKDEVKQQIELAGTVCTTADIWSSSNRSFFGYTCHWLDDNLDRKSVALACRRFSGSHTFLKINELLNEIHNEYNLNNGNIIATVTDNGSNFVKTFKEYGIERYYNTMDFITEEDEYTFENNNLQNYLPIHIRCCSHTLSLLATKDFENNLKKTLNYDYHKEVIQKCSLIWNKSHRPKSAELIKSFLGISLKSPVITRWNSLYDSFKQIFEFKDKIKEFCEILNVPILTENDLLYIEEYILINGPIAEAIDFLQQEKNILFGYMLPTLATIRNKLNKLKISIHLKILKQEIIELMEQSLVIRFSKYFALESDVDMAIIASAICPDVKFKWIKTLNPSLTQTNIENIIKRIKSKIEKEAYKDLELFVPKPTNTFFSFDLTDETATSSINSNANNEFLSFMVDSSTDLSVFRRYPKLKEIFKKYNTPLPSSAPVERMFSYAGLVNAPRRSSLTDENFEQLVILKVNSKN